MLSYVLLWRQFLFRWSCISTLLCCHPYWSHNGRPSPPPFIFNQTPFQKHNSLHYVSNAGWIGLWRTRFMVHVSKCYSPEMSGIGHRLLWKISMVRKWALTDKKKNGISPPKYAVDWFVGILNEFSAPLHNFIMGLFACHGWQLSWVCFPYNDVFFFFCFISRFRLFLKNWSTLQKL